MGYTEAKSAIDAAKLADDAASLAFAQETVYSPVPAKITFFTLRAESAPGVPFFPKAKVDVLAAILQKIDPIGFQLMFTSGVEVSHPDAQAMLDALPSISGDAITADDCDKIRALARKPLGQRSLVEWGLAVFDAGTIKRLPTLAAWEALSRDWDGWLRFMTFPFGGAGTVAAMLGVDADALAKRREAATAAVQDWRAKIEADADVSAMPATAIDLWRATA